MTTQPRLVNKQFNSPIGLYSEQNYREVLEREQQMLANGAIGIDFNNPAVGKPANLQNSAVLRMLEEEENRRGGRTGAKRVAWPPPQEGLLDPAESHQNNISVAQPQGGPYNSNQSPGLHQNNNYSQQATPYQQQQPQSYRPLKPLDVSSVGTGSPLASPAHNQSPHGYRPTTPASSKGWAPVHSPATTPQGTGSQKYFGAPQQGYPNQPQYQPVSQPYQQNQPQYQSPQPQYQQPQYQSPQPQYQQAKPNYQPQNQSPQYQQPQYQSPQPQYQQAQPNYQQQPSQYQPQPDPYHQNQAPYQAAVAQTQVAAPRSQPARQVEPPPSTITLRASAPVSQAPPPVFSTQPATASLKGGKHLRGDLKWPPEDVRQRMDEENRKLMELARGPACRPPRKERDYTPFFEQHALNSTYPGYKIPPGTQYFRPE
ncbi:unnamed protein product [Ceutorhynchus assimilis]|uniref:Zasp-like motif domain-containing protein n=1 Tax=Ceutorhynchus assimilis TaxID=467358 RepID=A0A9P0GPH1_9CUCU|nr:unnamed protein product [Ceutorhynchus assimilis]